MEIVRKKLSADELDPPGVRYVAADDLVQTLVGDTWVDTPAADPRTNTGGLLPPRTGGTAACDAAANVVAKIKSINDYAIASQDQALIASGVVGLIALFLPGIGLVAEALWLLAELILTIGTINVDTAFTSGVYDDLTCYFDCAADESGQWSADAIAAVLAQVNTDHSGIVYNVLSNIFYQLGLVGLNNAGATGEETGDCLSCVCDAWCYTVDHTASDGGFVLAGAGQGAYVPGTGWVAADVILGGSLRTILQGGYPFSSTLNLTSIGFVYDWHPGTIQPGVVGIGEWVNNFSEEVFTTPMQDVTEGDDLSSVTPVALSADSLQYDLQTSHNAYGGNATLKSSTLNGTGDPPTFLEAMGWVAC